jgi:hypothetical protein
MPALLPIILTVSHVVFAADIGTGGRLDAGGSERTTRTQCRRNQATLERDQIH